MKHLKPKIAVFLFTFLISLICFAESGIPFQKEDIFEGSWHVVDLTLHKEYLRLTLKNSSESSFIEIAPRNNTNSKWVTKYYKIMPIPGKNVPPYSLFQAITQYLLKLEENPNYIPFVTTQKKQQKFTGIVNIQEKTKSESQLSIYVVLVLALAFAGLLLYLHYRSRASWVSLLKNFLLALTSLVLALLFAEVFSRVVKLGPEIFSVETSGINSSYVPSDNPFLGYEMKPNERNIFSDGHNIYHYTNRHGFRDYERNIEKPEGTKRIILLGDSVVAGHGVKRLEDLIASNLQQHLDTSKWEVLSMGACGYCTRSEVELLRIKGIKFSPDIVVLLYVNGDWKNYNEQLTKFYWIGHSSIVNQFFKYSRFARTAILYIDTKFPNAFSKQKTDLTRWQQKAMTPSAFSKGLEILHHLATQNNFVPVIAMWPTFTENWDKFASENQQIIDFNLLKKEVEKYKIPILRLDANYKKEYQKYIIEQGNEAKLYKEYQDILAPDGMHASELGAKIAGKVLFQQLQPFLTD